ncbi:MAG: amidase [Dethiobacter sp.]|nr:amidase [Dethiobacter sp.]
MQILDLDATSLAREIRAKEISCLEAADAYISHLERVNPKVNCLVEDRFEQAREEARQCDRMLPTDSIKGKLFGVPVSIKEAFNVAGMRTTCALSSRRERVESADAAAVSRLKAEGAVVLGKSNTPILCFCQETDNKLYGRTNNPWDLSRTTGGSSGGEGALIAAGGAAVGLGADIGGSIRFPSHFNGVVGFKSGALQVPDSGVMPVFNDPYQQYMLGIGAIAKSVTDAELINSIISFNSPRAINPAQFELCIPEPHGKFPVGEETALILNRIREALADSITVNTEKPPFFEKAALYWQLIMSFDGGRGIAEVAFDNEKPRIIMEYLKEVTFGSSTLHRYLTWALIGANVFKPNSTRLQTMKEDIKIGKAAVNEYLTNRVLLLPVYHSTAPAHGELYRELFSIKKTFLKFIPYVAFANLWGLPALTVPVGTDKNGLPIGVQLISLVGNEQALFYFGRILEERYRGYIRCALYD